MAEAQPGGVKEKEEVNATALAVSDLQHTSIQAAEKTASELTNVSVQESIMPVTPKEGATNNRGRRKIPRKPRTKKTKINSDTSEPVVQVQPAITNNASSRDKKKQVRLMPEPSLNMMDIKPLAEAAEQGTPTMAEAQPGGVKEKEEVNTTALAVSDLQHTSIQAAEKTASELTNVSVQESIMPVIPKEGATNNRGRRKKPRKPRKKKTKINSETSEQVVQVQPAITNKASSRGDKKKQVRFMPGPSINTVDIKPLAEAAEQGMPTEISNQNPTTSQVTPVIAEKNAIINFKNPKKPPRMKKNKASSAISTEQALEVQPANIKKAEEEQVRSNQKPAVFKINCPKLIKPSHRYSVGKVLLPVITEDTSAELKELTAQGQSQEEKTDSKAAIQMQPAYNIGALCSGVGQTREHTSNVETTDVLVTQDEKAIDHSTNDMYQESGTGPQTKNVLAAVQSKDHGQKNDAVKNNFKENETKKNLPLKNVAEKDKKPQTSKDALQVTDERAQAGTLTPVPMHYLPTEAGGNDVEIPHTLKDVFEKPDEKGEQNAEEDNATALVVADLQPTSIQAAEKRASELTNVLEQEITMPVIPEERSTNYPRKPTKPVPLRNDVAPKHLRFFREFYDHGGRLCVPNSKERQLYVDGLQSQVKLTCRDPVLEPKIKEVIKIILNDITTDFNNILVPIPNLDILLSKMYNIIFVRLTHFRFTRLKSMEICKIIELYRAYFTRAYDIQFMYGLLQA